MPQPTAPPAVIDSTTAPLTPPPATPAPPTPPPTPPPAPSPKTLVSDCYCTNTKCSYYPCKNYYMMSGGVNYSCMDQSFGHSAFCVINLDSKCTRPNSPVEL